MDNQEVYMLTDEDGNEHAFIELFSFDSEDFGKSYIVLVPQEVEDETDMPVLPFSFNKDDEEGVLSPLETDAEFDMVEEVMNTIMNDDQLS
ncbi:uncharacterized protein YrzB (UPF0473 family) [Weissella uvarum]|uniref:DUF1292 domain-containing protein n=1 Tax=Weissella uvarum TaxID=1479233 RepID=UPI001960A372|nr:DUF1292 domain-containing protein [Weissella uvarum]MBM7618129.1 uncharacterized protein YrzB (UPF0473 family) [Weissella uvarum]MCM0595129.1 DUF1292 domain-containing protein [Weissella uvarum]